ncbi:hypothetical protein GCM10007052_26740 [Halioglobus japonicus]|nr:hypothetical protein GCM10007052_26740 [Halioglobus japonicus]
MRGDGLNRVVSTSARDPENGKMYRNLNPSASVDISVISPALADSKMALSVSISTPLKH